MMEATVKAIQESLSRAVLPTASYEPPVRPSSLEAAVEMPPDPESVREAFITEAQALSAQVYSPSNQAEALDLLLRIAQTCDAQAALAWDELHLPLPGVWEALAATGVQILDSSLPDDQAAREAHLAKLDGATLGVTGSLAGLADTGSLALLSGPGRGRLASLLPPVHVALLPLANLYPAMAAFFAAYPDVARQASNLVFVSGPSRTADIEQTLTMGVHGPRELHILLHP
jgi:L-lactate dehydrogenase complex protein LldG